jgi:hypothetical protein
MNGPILDPENVIGIVVETMLLQKGIEVREVTAVEQDHGLAVRRDVALGAPGKSSS